MRKKQKRSIFIVGLILLAVVVLAWASQGFPLYVGDTTQSSSMQILSISPTTINGEEGWIRVQASASGGAELLDINWGVSELNQKLKEGGVDGKATKSVTGGFRINEQSITFPFQQTGSKIYKSARQVKEGNFYSFISTCRTDCSSKVGVGEKLFEASLRGLAPFAGCWCLIGKEAHDVGTWSSLQKGDFSVTFAIDGLGSTTMTRDQQSANLIQEYEGKISNLAHIKFAGFLVGYDTITDPSYTPTLFSNNILLFEENTYANSLREEGNLISKWKVFDDPFSSYDEELIENYNKEMKVILVDKTSTYESQSYVRSVSKDQSGMKVILASPTEYPVFTIDLKAESVGIIKQSGIPQISNCQTFNMKSNELGESSFIVKNIGSGPGNFRLAVSDCEVINGFVFGGNNLGDFNANQERYFSLTLQGFTEQEGGETGSCKLKVYDVNDPTKSSQCNIYGNVEYNPGGKCSPVGKLICSPNLKSLMECSEEGKYSLKEACTNTCGYNELGVGYCLSDSESDEKDGLSFLDKIKGFFSNLFSPFGTLLEILRIVKWIALISVSLFSMFYSKGIIENYLGKKKSDIFVLWTLSLLIAVGIGFILYALLLTAIFWWILVGVLVFLILTNFALPKIFKGKI